MKWFWVFFLGMVGVLSLVGCAFRTDSTEASRAVQESITVYDKNDKKILSTENHDILEKFSKYASQDGLGTEMVDVFEEVPQDAQVAYKFVLKSHSNYDVQMMIYANYDYLTIENLPVLGTLKLKLSKEEADWFRHPNKW